LPQLPITIAETVCIAGPVCRSKADIVLALDQSSSIVQQEWGGMVNWETEVLGFARRLAGAFPIHATQTQVGVLKFNQTAEIVFNLNRYGDGPSLVNAIGNIPIWGGDTNIAIALRTARDMFTQSHGSRSDVHKILILVTDGTANLEELNTIPEARRTKEAGIKIYTVGITHQVDQDQLSDIASRPDYFFYAANFGQLNRVLQDLIAQSCPGMERSVLLACRCLLNRLVAKEDIK